MSQDQEQRFTFELGEQDGQPVVNDEEAAAYAAYKTGLTIEQVRAVQAADFEYLKRCGLIYEPH